MGRDRRSGFGYGMDEYEAKRNFRDQLNRSYGEDTYDGGGESITEWLKSTCVEKPIHSTPANKTKSVKVQPTGTGKLVNGFIVTNETPDLIRLQLSARYNSEIVAPLTVEDYAGTQAEAKKKAEDISKKHNTKVYVIPARLWLDERNKRLSIPSRILEVSPIGCTLAKPGKWSFEVEVRV